LRLFEERTPSYSKRKAAHLFSYHRRGRRDAEAAETAAAEKQAFSILSFLSPILGTFIKKEPPFLKVEPEKRS